MTLTPEYRTEFRLRFAQIARQRGVEWVDSVLRPLDLAGLHPVPMASIPDHALAAICDVWGDPTCIPARGVLSFTQRS